jgi:hypothetical protein
MHQALQQIAHMNLVGFVIAGERVHNQNDTPVQRELVLALPARQQRIEAVAVGVVRPARR